MSKSIIAGIIVAIVLSIGFYISQLYTQNSPTTASKGILFKKTLNLTAYKKVSKGTSWQSIFLLQGQYNNYSRSDRHDELVTVYCKSYCQD